jgi:hypothetical protein
LLALLVAGMANGGLSLIERAYSRHASLHRNA